ncbi:hypothetical protein SASPL_147899 [Salvia splendens]|uniref:NB-ARC domain-containing protein n=1 Tax=Salvia splendens TaxID=180675 RepID=A0A8X8WFB5_SALSN|nr:hypothetical protein SASPL_147899 [Salvia splendens]
MTLVFQLAVFALIATSSILLISKILEELPFSDEVEVESNPDILENTSSDQVEDQSRRDFLKKTSFGQVDVGSRQDFEKKNSHDDIKVESRQDILKRLQKALKDKTYLLILDDVWNQDRPKWDNFINSLLGVTSVKGNAIVITTRNTEVASTMQSLHTYELKGLSHEDCRSIIKAKTFGKQDIPSEFEAIGRKIATRCQGRKIESQELIEYWMAEGFLEANGSGEMECLGDKFMKVLLHNSLLQVAERDDYGNVESCVMHDLVHDLACSISVSCNNTEGGSRVRYMIHDEESRIPKEVAKYLRTLLFEGNIYGNMFADFDGLHVLIIADDECRKLPSLIRKLIHLRKLDISSTRIKYLPDWIGELHQLQTLNGGARELRELPIGDKNGCKIDELGSLNGLKGKLEKLIIRDCPKLERVSDTGAQRSQGSFTCLKRLEICECKALLYFPCEMVGSSVEELELKNLSSLMNLWPRLSKLRITDVSQFMAILSSEALRIDVSMEGCMESVEGLLQRCNSRSLTHLELKGREARLIHCSILLHCSPPKVLCFPLAFETGWLSKIPLSALQLHPTTLIKFEDEMLCSFPPQRAWDCVDVITEDRKLPDNERSAGSSHIVILFDRV